MRQKCFCNISFLVYKRERNFLIDSVTMFCYTAFVKQNIVTLLEGYMLISKKELLEKARAEFEQRMVGGFVCPIPKDAVPVVPKY